MHRHVGTLENESNRFSTQDYFGFVAFLQLSAATTTYGTTYLRIYYGHENSYVCYQYTSFTVHLLIQAGQSQR
jgi:hypothetical protein